VSVGLYGAGLAIIVCGVVEPGATVAVEGALDVAAGYRLAAAGREVAEDERLTLLEQIFDPLSRRRREMVQPGWRCLEVGAGRGSMAVWLAEQVGSSGHVVATDIDVSYLERLNGPNLEVVQHDILEDSLEPLDPGSFDLVCSRLMLFHLVGRQDTAIARMARCLRPGGWLIDEDADWGTPGPVDPLHRLYQGFQDAWRNGDWWASRGYDPVFGRKLPALFERCGLGEIQHAASSEVVRGGSPWARWFVESLEVIHTVGGGVATELQQREHEQIVATFADPSVWLLRELLHTCWGRRTG
jgi:SAM-dependent methyltransferase